MVIKNSNNIKRSNVDISRGHNLYLQKVDEVALEDEDDVADRFHATDERQSCNEDLDQRKKREAEDLHNPATALSANLVVTSNGVDQLQVLTLVKKEQLKLTKLENIHMVQKMMEKEGPRFLPRVWNLVGRNNPRSGSLHGSPRAYQERAGSAAVNLGFSASSAATISNAVAGLSPATAAQLIWTPVDVVSQRQRLMDQGAAISRYNGGVDAVRKIVSTEGVRGLYKGFGFSILTYAPSNAVWWASYSAMQRLICRGGGRSADVAVQAVSAVAALATMPLDTNGG
ncbi:uncharacterized protein LOC127808602 [Diospyros lotus]|uniref:uncharacterized protein LOC127808602 n=1 Tax=Diospyros lotus TaxID=55363 RepID=UPI00224E686B|nr:uncharacterized protein LOC127808602 [Diospyros lotus]